MMLTGCQWCFVWEIWDDMDEYSRDNFANKKSIITCNKQWDCTPGCSLVQISKRCLQGEPCRNPAQRRRSHLCGFSIKAKTEHAQVGSSLWKVGAGLHRTSKVQGRSETKATEAKKKASRQGKKKSLQEAKMLGSMCCGKAGGLKL